MTIQLTTKSCILLTAPLCLSIVLAGYLYAVEHSEVRLEEIKQETIQYWNEVEWYRMQTEKYETIASVFYCVEDE